MTNRGEVECSLGLASHYNITAGADDTATLIGIEVYVETTSLHILRYQQRILCYQINHSTTGTNTPTLFSLVLSPGESSRESTQSTPEVPEAHYRPYLPR